MSVSDARRYRPALYLVEPCLDEEAPTDPQQLGSLQDSFGDFAAWLSAQTASARTARERVTIVRAFGGYCHVDPRLAAVTDVVTYLSRPDLSGWTRLAYWHHLKAWFGWLQVVGRPDNPMDGMRSPKAPRGAPRPLTGDQVQQLLEAAGPRMQTWLLLGLHAGLRAHEIAKIRGSDFDGTELYVFGKGGVSALLPAHPRLLEEAMKYGRGFWFPSHRGPLGHVRPETVSHTSALYFSRFDIDGSIHRCRHTYATELLRAGVNVRVVQSLMRHSSLDTTARYTAVGEHERRAAIALLDWQAA